MTTPTLEELREREEMERNPERMHMQPAEGIGTGDLLEEAGYLEPEMPPQWTIAYKMFSDSQGDYGIPYPVPSSLWQDGAGALVRMRRADGKFAWSKYPPKRLAPKGTIECVDEMCNDAHLGGRRKMCHSIEQLIKHTRAFHADTFETYQKYFDQLADQMAMQNPRLQKLMGSVGLAAAATSDPVDDAFYCNADDECTRFFDTAKARDGHEASHKKRETADDHHGA